MTKETELWEGPFGDSYQDRNRPTEKDIENRLNHWESMFKLIYQVNGVIPKSVLEIGAGQGPNLLALEKLSLKIEKPLKLFATEVNQKARIKLSESLKNVEILDKIPDQPVADLVFTYGVMIHTNPAHIRMLQSQMHKAANRWLMCNEYFAPTTTGITYRGEKDALWLDDYGGKFLDNHSLRIIAYSFSWKRVSGLDNITTWVFEKTEKMI